MNTTAVIEHIVAWLRSYIQKSGTKGFVVGISGGIDSAVTSALVARTGFPVLCVEMPIHQSEQQVNRGKTHIDFLKGAYANVSSVPVELTSVFDALIATLPEPEGEEQKKLTLANTRARLRMTTLYYFAGIHKHLVAGTGNKVEDFGIGFFTKYGDGGVDLSPIADLLKSEVYELAEALGVHTSIIEAPPTDGLWGDQRTDEEQIGATYDELEWAMAAYHKGKSVHDFSGREKEVFGIFSTLHANNQHKMLPIPVCLIPEELK